MEIISVRGLSKSYEKFKLRDVSFSIDEGYIMGFIGRNGAGKTTTLKSMLGLVKPDCGEVTMFGKNFFENEVECKQEIGIVMGGVDYYADKKLSAIADVTKKFYKNLTKEKRRSTIIITIIIPNNKHILKEEIP